VDLKDGRAYLEKIVQAWVSVPPIRRERLRELSMEWLQEAIGERDLEGWDSATWSELLDGGIDGYLRTMRDGRHLANMVPAALDLCANEVAAMDVIALEAIKIFDPDVHDALPELIDALLGGDNPFDLVSDEKRDVRNLDGLNRALERSSHEKAARHLLSVLFPAAAPLLGGWRGAQRSGSRLAKRVSARPVLMRYLHLVLAPDEVPSTVVDDAVAALVSGPELRVVVDGIDDSQISDLLGRVRARVREQPSSDVSGCAMVVLALVSRMRRGPGFLDVRPSDHVRWFVQDLVTVVQPPERRVELACNLVADASTLSQRCDLLYAFNTLAGESRDPELELFDTDTFDRLARDLALDIHRSDAELLAGEANVLWLLQLMHTQLGQEAVLARCNEEPVLRAVVQTPGTEVRGFTDGRVALHIEPLLEIAGPDVLDALHALAEDGGALEADLRAALQKELRDRPT